MSFFKEFKEFAIKGNMIDLAVGVVIGGAFGKIINSIVADIIMPPFGLVLAGIDFKKLKWVMKEATKDAEGKDVPEVALTYGNFIQVAIEFFIIAFCIFLLLRIINKMRHRHTEEQAAAAAAAPPAPAEDVVLLKEIRDLLKERNA
ncbi:MAG: large-conductance mechanosensitive channel protein MscL [Chitinophagales bacterium]|nr:large-conductance mechanosensitive channel protein MscL [Chitinophagales bacterium]